MSKKVHQADLSVNVQKQGAVLACGVFPARHR